MTININNILSSLGFCNLLLLITINILIDCVIVECLVDVVNIDIGKSPHS